MLVRNQRHTLAGMMGLVALLAVGFAFVVEFRRVKSAQEFYLREAVRYSQLEKRGLRESAELLRIARLNRAFAEGLRKDIARLLESKRNSEDHFYAPAGSPNSELVRATELYNSAIERARRSLAGSRDARVQAAQSSSLSSEFAAAGRSRWLLFWRPPFRPSK
jgi:hypothetical protein